MTDQFAFMRRVIWYNSHPGTKIGDFNFASAVNVFFWDKTIVTFTGSSDTGLNKTLMLHLLLLAYVAKLFDDVCCIIASRVRAQGRDTWCQDLKLQVWSLKNWALFFFIKQGFIFYSIRSWWISFLGCYCTGQCNLNLFQRFIRLAAWYISVM